MHSLAGSFLKFLFYVFKSKDCDCIKTTFEEVSITSFKRHQSVGRIWNTCYLAYEIRLLWCQNNYLLAQTNFDVLEILYLL